MGSPRSRPSPSRTGASSTSIATGCSARSTRPRTRSRRRSCGRGERARRFEAARRFRAWLYKIATNVCLDAIRRDQPPAPLGAQSLGEVPWLQPYPDHLLDEIAPRDDEPDAVVVARETIELAFLAAIQLLPPRQRAVLILRDVLDWSAKETASLLDMTVVAVNSALQRARATMQANRPHGSRWSAAAEPTEAELELLGRSIEAHERADVAAGAMLSRRPPDQRCHRTRLVQGLGLFVPRLEVGCPRASGGSCRHRANRQPTSATYLREPGDTVFRAFKLDVIRFEGGFAEVITFGAYLFPEFGLPPTL